MRLKTILVTIMSLVGVVGLSSIAYGEISNNLEDSIIEDEVSEDISLEEFSISEEELGIITETSYVETEISPPITTITEEAVTETPTTTQTAPQTTKSTTKPAITQATKSTTKSAVTQATTKQATAQTTKVTTKATTKAPVYNGSAPNFTVYNDNGIAVKLSDYAGKAVVLNFWASWCPPCKEEMPDFQTMYNKYGQSVVFLMVNLTDGSRETKTKAKQFISNNGYTFPIFFDTSSSAANAYGISSIPQTFFITKTGDISSKNIGGISASKLESGIKAIIG